MFYTLLCFLLCLNRCAQYHSTLCSIVLFLIGINLGLLENNTRFTVYMHILKPFGAKWMKAYPVFLAASIFPTSEQYCLIFRHQYFLRRIYSKSFMHNTNLRRPPQFSTLLPSRANPAFIKSSLLRFETSLAQFFTLFNNSQQLENANPQL